MRRDLRAAILDATFAEVAEQGLHGLSLEAVARRAGTARASVYRHFPGGRDELVVATIRREVDRLFALVPRPGSGADPIDALAAMLSPLRQAVADHEVLARLLATEAAELVPALLVVRPVVVAAMEQFVAEALTDVEVMGGDHAGSIEFVARLLLSFLETSSTTGVGAAAGDRRTVERLLRPILPDG